MSAFSAALTITLGCPSHRSPQSRTDAKNSNLLTHGHCPASRARASMAHIYCSGLVHVCLQTSCWVVQLRVQGALPAGFRVPVVGPTTTQAFWQFITWVSQATKQAVDV